MSELKDKDEQYSVFLKYKENNNENKSVFFFRVFFITIILAGITYLAMYIFDNFEGLSSAFNGITNQNKVSIPQTNSKNDLSPSKFNFKMLSKYQNILILGVDSNGPDTLPFSGVRSDTIIIVNVDINGKSVNAISIPRDSKVYIADEHGIQKINAAYAIGGIELTKKTIEETLGIKIHNYVIVNAEGVRKLIDAIGGVPIHVDQNMHYNDYSAKLHVDFKKGDYVLSGKQAEEYLRFRKDHLGDIGRVQRQQKFIKALIERLKSPESLKRIPEVLKIANLYTRTDLNLYQMSQYASVAREIDMNKVEFVMLPGAPNKKGIISYWILDPEKTQQTINRLIYRKKVNTTENEITVGIMYSRSKEIEAMSLKEQIKSLGYDVNCVGRSNLIEKSEIVGYNAHVAQETAKNLKRKINEISKYNYVHSPVRNYCNSSDLVITIKKEENEDVLFDD